MTALICGTGLGALPSSAAAAPQKPSAAPAPAPFCSGEYGDSLLALSMQVRSMEQANYSYCIRNTAVYECLSYAADGNLRKARHTAIAHGTGFGYQQKNGNTLLLTNYHVAEWPLVTDERHPVTGVPNGCKRITDTLKIVDNESDSYDRDDIALTHVVSDVQLDASVLRAKDKTLPILPWKLGRSAALKERNIVEVRGFPLGVFQTTNDGKVVSPYDHDTDRDWDHDDFVIDALLSHGQSGSPVLAVSCKTGEFELVGMYHAAYSGASALNVVIGIDQLRNLMTTLKKKPRSRTDNVALDPAARARVMRESPSVMESFFPFGPLTALVLQRADKTLVFSVFARGFPLQTQPMLVIEDRPAIGDFGQIGRIWFGAPQGLKEYAHGALDAETLGQINHVLDGLRAVSVAAMDYRAAVNNARGSREQFERMSRLERALTRAAESRADLAALAIDLAEHLGPKGDDAVVPMSVVLTSTSVMNAAVQPKPQLSSEPAPPGNTELFDPSVHARHPFTKKE